MQEAAKLLDLTSYPALLVSVRDAAEAIAALDGGADVIDVKEPLNGPLGRASTDAIRDVVRAIGGRAPVTAALGELCELATDPFGDLPSGLAAVKYGLAQALDGGWIESARVLHKTSPLGTAVVPVMYADHLAALTPPVEKVLARLQAAAFKAPIIAIDTYDKSGPGAIEHLGVDRLASLLWSVQDSGARVALAGRIGSDCLHELPHQFPDIVAVRGSVCRGARTDHVCNRLVSSFAHRIHSVTVPAPRHGS